MKEPESAATCNREKEVRVKPIPQPVCFLFELRVDFDLVKSGADAVTECEDTGCKAGGCVDLKEQPMKIAVLEPPNNPPGNPRSVEGQFRPGKQARQPADSPNVPFRETPARHLLGLSCAI